MLLTAKKISEYYCCSWGEAIETALPAGLRSSKITALNINPQDRINAVKQASFLRIRQGQPKDGKNFILTRSGKH